MATMCLGFSSFLTDPEQDSNLRLLALVLGD
jgi:hypothetical protein